MGATITTTTLEHAQAGALEFEDSGTGLGLCCVNRMDGTQTLLQLHEAEDLVALSIRLIAARQQLVDNL